MKIAQLLLAALLVLSLNVWGCGKIEEGYEDKDIIYSVCPNLPQMPSDSVSKLVDVLLSQYQGTPDDLLIYFVASRSYVGKVEFNSGELLGYYYTQSHKVVVMPDTPEEREFVVTWKQ